jgi:hypothetical protein
MNLQNFRIEPNSDVLGDWFIFGDICDFEGNVLATFGEKGISVFAWWNTQDVHFQQSYSSQFAIIMAKEILAGTTV